jgi:hypothetical protein
MMFNSPQVINKRNNRNKNKMTIISKGQIRTNRSLLWKNKRMLNITTTNPYKIKVNNKIKNNSRMVTKMNNKMSLTIWLLYRKKSKKTKKRILTIAKN